MRAGGVCWSSDSQKLKLDLWGRKEIAFDVRVNKDQS